MRRTVCWFSCGATSAIATKLTLADHPNDEVVIAYTDPGSEHKDNVRFRHDCETWFNRDIIVLRSDKYENVDQVIDERRYLNGPAGALCTVELKRKLRFAFQRPDDLHVWGYDASEQKRVDKFRANNPEIDIATPLLDRGLTKPDCLAMLVGAGIELPAMYRLGYRNNNCIGCVKGGMGYWNKIRVDFPVVFARRAAQERELNHSCITDDDDGMVFLDELDPTRGNYRSEPSHECSLMCASAEMEYTA